jgi:outer membrane protein TolC
MFSLKYYIFSFSFLFALAGIYNQAFAESSLYKSSAANYAEQPLTLTYIFEQIDQNHPVLQSAQVGQDIAKADQQIARSAFIPRYANRSLYDNYLNSQYKRKDGFTLAHELAWQTPFAVEFIVAHRSTSLPLLSDDGLTYPNNKAYFDSVKKSKLAGYTDHEASVGLRLPLLRNLLIDPYRADLKKAGLQRTIADYNLEQKRLELYRKAAEKYYDWLATGLQYRVAENLLQIAQKRTFAIEERALRGAVPKIDVIEAESQVKSREENLAKSLRNFQKESFALSLFLWDQGGDFPRVPQMKELVDSFDEPKEIPLDLTKKHLEESFKIRPEMLGLQQQKKQAEINLRLARNEILPKVDLEVLPTQDLSQFEDGTNFKGSINIDVPLYPLKAQGQINKAQANMQTLELQRRQLMAQINNEVQDALSYLDTSRQRILKAREARAKIAELLDGEQTRFQFGASTLFLLNVRESAYADSENKVIEAQADYHKALAYYKYATALWLKPGFAEAEL